MFDCTVFGALAALGCGNAAGEPKPPPAQPMALRAEPLAAVTSRSVHTGVPALDSLFGRLTPNEARETLLLGVEVTRLPIEAGPDVQRLALPSCRLPSRVITLIASLGDGADVEVGVLPFLAVPKRDGFLFLGDHKSESGDHIALWRAESVSEAYAQCNSAADPGGADAPAADEPTGYTQSTPDSEQLAAEQRDSEDEPSEESGSDYERPWSSHSVSYATQKALCLSVQECTDLGLSCGGMFTSCIRYEQYVEGLGRPLERKLLRMFGQHDSNLAMHTLASALGLRFDDQDQEFDPRELHPTDVDWCLTRREGLVLQTAEARDPMIASWVKWESAPFARATRDLAPSQSEHAIDAEAMREAFPDWLDTFVGNARRLAFVTSTQKVELFDVATGAKLTTLELDPRRVVMAETSSGSGAREWLKALTSATP